MIELYGHPFSSYTWKALIPLYASAVPFTFRSLEDEANNALVQSAGPQGKFPVLTDGDAVVFEATAIVEYLALHHLPDAGLIPADPAAALEVRKLDRVFDNYVMNVMQGSVDAAIRNPGNPDPEVLASVAQRLERSYAWLESWLGTYARPQQVTLVECAAAPSLFYADWVHPVPDTCPRLIDWREHLLALPAVSRCVEEARPYRPYFPLGAPDRD